VGVYLNLPVTSTADIAAAVRTALAVELARVDVAVSTRATPADVQITAASATSIRGEIS
jgi:hypothetical protein